jgi:hypothetical protein
MLNKDVCKECMRRTNLLQWSDEDERYWKIGIVYCNRFITDKGSSTNIHCPPPDFCPYAVEQVVSQ